MVSDLSAEELTVIARVVELWDEILTTLAKVEAYPRDYTLHINTELQPGYLGWIGCNEGGRTTFQPAEEPDVEQ